MLDFKKTEEEVASFWKKNKIVSKLKNKNSKGKPYFVLDGPPYANFTPHVGHIKNTVFKDLLIRIALMKGNKVLFQPGFDTHGLPVENMVENKLGLKSKKDIETYGIEKFMQDCRESAVLNKNLWMDAYHRLGSLYDGEEPYLTYENYFIESAWWAFNEMYKKKMVYEGEKPVMWCPHCETSLAGYEVTDSYKEVVDTGVYVLFKLVESDEHLLVYTTTPWSLPGDVAIAIAPEETYVTVELGGKKIILAKERLVKLSEMGFGYSILEEYKGKKIVGKKYEPILDVPLQRELLKGNLGKSHVVVASIAILKERVSSKMRTKKGLAGKDVFEEFVTVTDGTGLVHTAPGHGKTDFFVGQHYGLAAVSPLDDRCFFTPEAGFSGFVKKADEDIISVLEEQGKLLFKEKIKHSYPLCWRCKSPLIFRLSKQLFFRVEEVKKIILKENEKVNWHPDFARERFENWVENAEDWNISRQRYWGIPIPIWKSEDGEEIVISSEKELEKLSGQKFKDLHVVEKITFKKNGKTFTKVKGVLDVWFDSGVAPFASLGYPHKNKELFEENFPVSRINEAQDQIRGWFYSLMFCSAAVFKKPAFKEVSMTGWVLDRNGNKMSKSLGNVVTAEKALDELGADMLRYYFCWDVAPYETQRFNVDIAKKEIGRITNVLWNLINLSVDGKLNLEDIEDSWIISRLESTTKLYTEKMETFEFQEALREISKFILDDLSRSYIQMTREKENGAIIAHCLKKVLILLAPVSPFITEKIWQNLREKKFVEEESVHLSDWPKADSKRINKNLEEEFDNALKIIEKGMAARDESKIGLRWPLAKANVYCDFKISDEVLQVISRQLNIKKIVLKKSKELSVELDAKTTPELEAEGFARELARKIQDARKKAGLQKSDFINLKINAEPKFLKVLEKNSEFLRERTNAKHVKFEPGLSGSENNLSTIKNEKVCFAFDKL